MDMEEARSPLEMIAFAAWVNVPVDQIPDTMRAPTCPATMEAWKRVADAISTASEQAVLAKLRDLLNDKNPEFNGCWPDCAARIAEAMIAKLEQKP